jgi:outer membrane protein OmpA-like peptidoglycan-associated protein
MRRALRMAVVPAILLVASGCATKDWVNKLVGQKEAEIDQRVGTRVGAVESRVGEQGQRINEVGENVTQVRTRADAAYSRADEVNDRLSRLWNGRHKRQLVETIHVQFGFDKWDLTDGAQTALAQVVKDLRQNPNLTVDLEGYTDPVGAPAYNIGLSQRRVESVRRYLIEQGAEMPRVHSIGLGPLNGQAREEHAKLRRVTVRLMVNQD